MVTHRVERPSDSRSVTCRRARETPRVSESRTSRAASRRHCSFTGRKDFAFVADHVAHLAGAQDAAHSPFVDEGDLCRDGWEVPKEFAVREAGPAFSCSGSAMTLSTVRFVNRSAMQQGWVMRRGAGWPG